MKWDSFLICFNHETVLFLKRLCNENVIHLMERSYIIFISPPNSKILLIFQPRQLIAFCEKLPVYIIIFEAWGGKSYCFESCHASNFYLKNKKKEKLNLNRFRRERKLNFLENGIRYNEELRIANTLLLFLLQFKNMLYNEFLFTEIVCDFRVFFRLRWLLTQRKSTFSISYNLFV